MMLRRLPEKQGCIASSEVSSQQEEYKLKKQNSDGGHMATKIDRRNCKRLHKRNRRNRRVLQSAVTPQPPPKEQLQVCICFDIWGLRKLAVKYLQMDDFEDAIVHVFIAYSTT
ncbi:unnamed protein product [Caretta caretta]